MTIDWLPFDRLTPRQLYEVLRLRQRVFVKEQACIYVDCDGLDPRAWVGLGVGTDGNMVATARILPPGLVAEQPSIGRVVVDGSARGSGLGRDLMESAMAQLKRLFPGQGMHLSAQQRLTGFYRSLGFAETGAPYDEDGIVHVTMVREA